LSSNNRVELTGRGRVFFSASTGPAAHPKRCPAERGASGRIRSTPTKNKTSTSRQVRDIKWIQQSLEGALLIRPVRRVKKDASDMTLAELSPFVSLIKDIALIAAAVTGTAVGIFGLHTWSRQLRGTFKYELAKQLLVSVYRTRDTIVALRSSRFRSEEVPVFHLVVSAEDMPSEQFREYLVEAYRKRWASFESAYNEFQKVRAEAEVVLGKDISGLCYQFDNCYYYLEQASHHYFKWIENVELHRAIPELFRRQTERTMGIVGESEKDDYGDMLRRVVGNLEEAMLPIIDSGKIA